MTEFDVKIENYITFAIYRFKDSKVDADVVSVDPFTVIFLT